MCLQIYIYKHTRIYRPIYIYISLYIKYNVNEYILRVIYIYKINVYDKQIYLYIV